MSKVQFPFTLTIVIAPILLLAGCLHSDRLGIPDVRFVNRQHEIYAGGEADVLIEIAAGGDRFKSSFYEGPVDVTFETPDQLTIEPSKLNLQMSRENEHSGRGYAEGTVVLRVASNALPGEYEVKVVADNGKNRSQRFFYFDVIEPVSTD